MKRFFFIFTIILIAFLLLAAGCMAVLEYGAITTYNRPPGFLWGWGITLIPYHGATILYPNGDVFLIKQAAGQDIPPGRVLLVHARESAGIMSVLVTGSGDGLLQAERPDGSSITVPSGDIVGVYQGRVQKLGDLLVLLRSPVSMIVFAAVLILSIALCRALPGGKQREDTTLSPSDGEISSILY